MDARLGGARHAHDAGRWIFLRRNGFIEKCRLCSEAIRGDFVAYLNSVGGDWLQFGVCS